MYVLQTMPPESGLMSQFVDITLLSIFFYIAVSLAKFSYWCMSKSSLALELGQFTFKEIDQKSRNGK